MKINYTSDPIPVKLYVKQFIEENNLIRQFVLNNLYKLFSKPEKKEPETQTTLLFAEPEAAVVEPVISIPVPPKYYIKFPLPERVFRKKGFMLTESNVKEFSEIMEDYIKMLFECELQANIRRSIKEQRKFPIQEMILDLRKEFSLSEEDLPFETIKKSLQRFCERENVDLQSIKIFAKSVPKKHCSVSISSHCIPRKEFQRKFNVSNSTYARMKNERGELSIMKKGKEDFVNLALSELSPIYVITYSQQ